MHSVIEEVAGLLRDMYIERFREYQTRFRGRSNWTPGAWWDGGEVKGKNRPNIWAKAASFIIRRHLPLAEFVHFVVFDWRDRPAPNHLCSEAAAQDFLARRNVRRLTSLRHIELAFEHQKHAAQAAADFYRELAQAGYGSESPQCLREMVLLDESRDLTALFRYCLAVHEGHDDVAEKYLPAALMQYLSDASAYDKVWKDWIPEILSEASGRLRKLVG